MADEHPMVDFLRDAGAVADTLADQTAAEAEAILDEMGETDQDLRDLTIAQLRSLAATVVMMAYREMAMDENIRTDAEAFVYLGPDDSLTRPFCEELVGMRMTWEEIMDLDNGTDLDVLTGCGGYNCRHQWMPLYGSMVGDYEPGDVDAANAAAE